MLNRRFAVAPLAAFLFCAAIARDAQAAPFQAGDFTTYIQDEWGDGGLSTTASTLLSSHFNNLYGTLGYLQLGVFSPADGLSPMFFTSASALFTYLPASGTPGALVTPLVDPTSSSSGIFGGEVTALRLNVDFSDARYTQGSLALPFGDLILHSYSEIPQVNGLTVRQVLAEAETLLSGGTTDYSIAAANALVMSLNSSFWVRQDGYFNPQFAQDHLRSGDQTVPQPVPEPTTLSLLGVGAAALAIRRRSVRGQRVRS